VFSSFLYSVVYDFVVEDAYAMEDEYDSEDSNQENYFVNDYPEEEDYFSVDEDDIAEAVARCYLGKFSEHKCLEYILKFKLLTDSDNELSTDDEESRSDDFVFCVPDEDEDDYYAFSDDERNDFKSGSCSSEDEEHEEKW
jgi:hypothetical protein